MGLTAVTGGGTRQTGGFVPRVVHAPEVMPVAISVLDNDSYEPLASMAQEIGREFGGDGLLVTWHEDSVEPQHLFAEGGCEPQWAAARDVAELGASAAHLRKEGARSHWRLLTSEPPAGVLTTTIPAERGVLTISTLFKRIGRTTRMSAGETAARLLPFLQPFFRTWLSQFRTAATVRALTAVINDSDIGMLLLDRSGQIIFANSTAEEILVRGDGLRRKGGMLAGENMTDTLRLHAAIENAVADQPSKRRRPSQRMVALRRGKAAPLIAAVVANAETSSIATDCAAVVYLVDPEQDLAPLIEPVCRFYGLSPAETRLAGDLVAGLSLAEAAEHLNLREQTARTYLKQVFFKTDTNRQAELVRLLLLSAVRAGHTAPDAADLP